MKKKSGNIYTNLDIDIQTLNNFMFEKHIKPVIIDNRIEWYDKNENLHSFHGFPSRIIFEDFAYHLFWHIHGKYVKSNYIKYKSESEIIAEKIQARNFAKRAKG